MTTDSAPGLARRLNLFDATMLVMGGTIGSGIFVNAYVVARQVHTPFLVLAAWVFGGLVASAGAFVYAELAARRPETGGQYAYLREAYHPAVAFAYGWVLLFVIQTGGMAAVAVTFARFSVQFTGASIPEWFVALLALAALTIINCAGVRAGSTMQNVFMVLKIAAIAALVVVGLLLAPSVPMDATPLDRPVSFDLVTAVGASLVPVFFAYGGWQTASFVAGELRDPRRDLPRGLVLGVAGVIACYVLVNLVYVRALGVAGLAATEAPASEVMRLALGETGARMIAIGIAISTVGFLSQGMLTAPRVYYAMAEDRLFFRSVAWLHPRTRVPVVAIALQGVLAMVIAAVGRYEQILNYVTSVDFIFFGLTATCVFVFRRRDAGTERDAGGIRVPGHPWTTLFFVAASWFVVLNTVYAYPENSVIGLGILCAGVPIYFAWRWWGQRG